MFKRVLQIIFSSAILLICFNAHPQKFLGGLHAGVNGSQIWGDEMSGFNKGGLLAGVFIDYPFKDRMFFTMELNYTQKGSRRNIDEFNTNPGLWNLLRISYLEIPVFINYRFSEKVDVNFGLSYGIKVGVKYIDLNGIEDPDFDFLRPYDFGFYFGGNYRAGKKFVFNFRIGTSLITVGEGKSNPIWARTNTGLINIVTSCSVKYYFISPK